jgi:hypothetical protein
MFRHRKLLSMLFALSALAAGCDLPFSLPGVSGSQPQTPEEAARVAHSEAAQASGTPVVQNFHLLGTRAWGNRAVVVSTDTAQAAANVGSAQWVYSDLVYRNTGGWYSYTTIPDMTGASMPPRSLVCPSTEIGADSVGDFSIVYGRVRLPDVASVEVDFSNGKTLTDTTTDGIFGVLLPSMHNATDLRVKDSSGRALHTVNLGQIIPATGPNLAPGELGSNGGSAGCIP